MLYVQEKVVKLGGIYLEGQVTSVEVQEAGSVYVAQDEKGRYKKSQPVGYENAKVMIDILLEDTKTATTLEQLTEMQRLFKPYGQDKPKLLPIVNEDCTVIVPLAENVALKKEVVRKPYTSSTKTSDTSYEYTIKLEEDELVGTFISEMALIDEDGDVVAFSNFLAKGKDETEVTFTIEDNY